MRMLALSSVLVILVALSLPASAANPFPSKQTMEVVAFSSDGKLFAVKVLDENLGSLFQVRDGKKDKLVDSVPFQPDDEKKAWARLKRKHDLTQKPVESQDNPTKGVSLMTRIKDGRIQIMMMKGEQIRPYSELELMKTKDGEPASASVKQVVWDGKGKVAVIVYHQKIKDLLEWEGDFVTSFKYRSYRVSFDAEPE